MNHREIEKFKAMLMRLSGQGCRIKCTSYGIDGKLVGIGFKPLWTSSMDSKIDKMELNILDSYGRVIPFNFHYIVGYEIVSSDEKRLERAKNISMNIHVFAPNKVRSKEPYDKIQLDLAQES